MTQTIPLPLWEKKITIQQYVELAVHRRISRSPCILPLFDFGVTAPSRIYDLHSTVDNTPQLINLLFPLASKHYRFGGNITFERTTRDFVTGLIDLENSSFFHGDLRSSNTCLYRGYSVLIDLGNTKPIADYQYATKEEPRHTYLANIAPEMITEDHKYGKEIDIWGLGITLLELYDRYPLMGHTTYSELHKNQLALFGRGSPTFEGLDPEIAEFISSLLVIDPSIRPSLRSLASKLGITVIPASMPKITTESISDYLSIFKYSESLLTKVTQGLFETPLGGINYTKEELIELTQLLFETNGALYPR